MPAVLLWRLPDAELELGGPRVGLKVWVPSTQN